MQKSCALVEPKAQKQWKSLCESDNSRFLCFFDSLTFGDKCENHEISKSIWRYPQRHFGDFHENMKVDVWKIRFFDNRSGAYIVSILELFRVAPMQL